jgi:HPt (histidine-containing phosphotransfer) domain-containing protein
LALRLCLLARVRFAGCTATAGIDGALRATIGAKTDGADAACSTALMQSLQPTAEAGLRAGVLDAQALARLQALDPGGHAGLVQRVLATYTASLHRLLEQLAAARAAGDREGLRQAAHTLKSSSASVGALELSALCAQAEAGARDGDTVALPSVLDRLVAEGERILAGLRAR